MLNHASVKRFFYLGVFLLLASCGKKDDGGPADPVVSLASGLGYSPASLTLQAGTAGSSNKPTVSGTLPIAYNLVTSPASNGAITIDSEGKIKAAATLAAGSYTVSVTATNAAGSAKFDNVYTVNVTAPAGGPQNLTYTPASVTVTQGAAVSSALPSVTSTSTVTYTISTTPATAAITINNQGVISATTALPAGSYSISVTATNADGPRTFTNAYTIIVNAPGGGTVGYEATIKGIIQSNCGSCHISGAQTELGNYIAAKNNIDEILRRINLSQGAAGMMPNGGTKLSQQTINTIQKWKDDGLLQ